MTCRRRLLAAAIAGALAGCAHEGGMSHHRGHGAFHGGRHGNPKALAEYVRAMEDPARDTWQKPEQVLDAIATGLLGATLEGRTVCDIGVGPGYFTRRIARRVGAKGRVFAVDVEPRMLEVLGERLQKDGLANVTPVLGGPDGPRVPPDTCDVVLIVDTYHHFPDGVAYLKGLGALLRPGGRVVNIDFHKRELPVGPPVDHKIAREDFLRDAERAGFVLEAQHDLLPHQYFLVLRPR